MKLVRLDNRKRLGLLMLCLFGLLGFGLAKNVNAAPALERAFQTTQPSGEKFTVTQRGDEFFHYMETSTGDIVEKGTDGYWYYSKASKKTSNGKTVTELVATTRRYKIDQRPSNALRSNLLEDLENTDYKREASQVSSWSSIGRSTSSYLGEKKVLVILVELSDTSIRYSEEDWHDRIFGNGSQSVAGYYHEVSQGKIQLTPVSVSGSRASNAGIVKVGLPRNHLTNTTPNHQNGQLALDAVVAADSQVNYSLYDKNKDGYLTKDELSIVTIIAGNEAAYYSACSKPTWGHWAMLPVLANVQLDGIHFNRQSYTQFGEVHFDPRESDNGHMATIGIIAHELGHDFDLPDLYDTDTGGNGLGPYSLMAMGSWLKVGTAYAGSTPSHLDAFCKMKLGIISPTIAFSGQADYELNQFNDPQYKVLKVQNYENKNEYLLIENRQFSGFDNGLRQKIYSGGIAIYHVNETYQDNQKPAERLVTIKEACEGYNYGTSQLDDHSFIDKYDSLFYSGKGSFGKNQNQLMNPEVLPAPVMENGGYLPFYFECVSSSQASMVTSVIDGQKAVEKLTIQQEPAKTSYVAGESFDPNGITLIATLVDQTVREIPIEVCQLSYDFSKAGNGIPVTITYGGESVTLTVTVTEKICTSLEIVNEPTKLIYAYGETVNLSGLVVRAHYNNGKNELITSYQKEIVYNGSNSYIDISYMGQKRRIPFKVNPIHGWITENGKRVYYLNGTKLVNKLVSINGKGYYLGSDGAVRTGWVTLQGWKYYFNPTGSALGVAKVGWAKISGKWYYFDQKEFHGKKGWLTLSGKKYYFDIKSSHAITGWKTIAGKKYYFKSDRTLATGWTTINKKKHYFRGNGTIKAGWITVKKKKYYLKSDASVTIGWKKIGKKKYYFQKNGVMVKRKTMKIGKKRYKFNSSGVCTNP